MPILTSIISAQVLPGVPFDEDTLLDPTILASMNNLPGDREK